MQAVIQKWGNTSLHPASEPHKENDCHHPYDCGNKTVENKGKPLFPKDSFSQPPALLNPFTLTYSPVGIII